MLSKLLGKLFRPRCRGATGTGTAAGQVATNPAPRDGAASTCAELLKRAESIARAGQLNVALEAYRACMLAYPRSIDACLGAAGVLTDLWAIDEAVAAYERALELAPAASVVFSALLFHLHYQSPFDAQRMFEMHRRFGALMCETGPPPRGIFAQAPEAQRRLRIGYLSPNFSRHSAGYFIEPVIRCHDREHYEVFCYYSHPASDDATRRMRDMADGWRDVAGIDDTALECMIVGDKIDILVDLAGHTKGNRLGVLARCPAPVQMTWLGYPDTTGLAAMDYRISDATADPPPAADALHTESLLRIDGCFLSYLPPPDAPPVATRDCAAAVVFSSFNNIAKLNDETIRMWGKILAAVPASRLVLKASSLNYPDTVDRLLDAFERSGVDPARIDVQGWIADRTRHLDLYGGIDIALDTFPYNGTTTTCEALWMGVPVITLAGDVHMARVGASILHCAGLDELIANSAQDYVSMAVALAADAARRQALRAGLRARLLASPLLDHAGFTRKLEDHWRRAWLTWCAGQHAA